MDEWAETLSDSDSDSLQALDFVVALSIFGSVFVS